MRSEKASEIVMITSALSECNQRANQKCIKITDSSTIICFDFDLNPESRFATPTFYGYVPSDRRSSSLVFTTMFIFSVCHITIKILGVALLATIGTSFVAIFLGSDMLLFLCIKISRQDLRYYLRFDGIISWVVSLCVRFLSKLM